MKRNRLLAVLIIALLTIELIPTVSFAATKQQLPSLNYVAFGDSMTQGYYFYDYNKKGIQGGWEQSSPRSEIKLFEKYLKENNNVKLYNLSLQGLLPDEVWALFSGKNDRLNGSAKSHFEAWIIGDDGWGIFNSFDEMAEYYKNATINADVITYDIGMNYFGTYIGSRMDGEVNEDAENIAELMDCLSIRQKNQVAKIRKQIKKILGKNATIATIADTVDALIYGYASYLYYTDKCINWIYNNNKDADNLKLVVAGAYNPHPGLTITVKGKKINFSKVINTMMSSLNSYLLKTNKNASRFAYADMTENMPESFADEFYNVEKSQDVSLDAKCCIGEIIGINYDKVKAAFDAKGKKKDTKAYKKTRTKINKLTEICCDAMTIRKAELDQVINSDLNKDRVKEAVENGTELTQEELVALHMYIRLNSATGFGAHPSPNGEAIKFENLKTAYEKIK